MENTLSLNQRQELRLSQSLIQKLEMLSLSYEELEEAIKKEEESNPFLEVKGGKYSVNSTYERADASLDYLSSKDEDEKAGWLERAISEKESLYDHLRFQIESLDLSDKEKDAALIIASSLDEHGFLKEDVFSILPQKYHDVAISALNAIKTLDPTGVGARDYKESLKIQLKELHLNKSDEEKISFMIDNMELIRGGRPDAVAKKLSIEVEEAELLIGVLKTLTPYPGEKFSTSYDSYIHPDIAIKKNPSTGELEIIDYGDNLPDVTLSADYLDLEEEMKKDKKKNKQALSYIKENKEKAKAIIDAIELRTTNLHKVALYLVEKQRSFFLNGISSLVPDQQQNMASFIGLSLSSISRLCSKKYIETDYGTFPVSFFFSSTKGFLNDEKEEKSKNAIKETIREIIKSYEGKKAPSDQKIADELEKLGIKIARRTVAKYRSELQIDSSYNR